MSHSRGLAYEKFDLHVHTPASSDYQDGAATPQDIVDTALKAGLRGIAVTDHNSAAWIDHLMQAASATELVVYPGVEVNVTGGERGVHVICLFGTDKNAEHVSKFLHTIQIYNEGSTEVASELSVGLVADKLFEYDPAAIAVLAHCASSKGVSGDMKGATRTQIFSERRINLLGAETSQTNFLDDQKKKDRKRVIDIFDGTDPLFGNRKLGVYQASDSHSLASIGKGATFFKVDAKPGIEDLRQCFIDRDARIRQTFEYKPTEYPKLDAIRIKSGFLDGMQIQFHENLNSILGAKGAGKSLVVEFLRFALDQPSMIPEIHADYDSKLQKTLKTHGEVEVDFTDDSGKRYRVTRTLNPAKKNPTTIVDLDDGSQKAFNVAQAFPVLFLSQGEATRIAEDPTRGAQRVFIDRFFDFYAYQQALRQGYDDLRAIDQRFADCLQSHLRIKQLDTDLATAKEELDKLGRQITNPIFSEFKKRQEIGDAIDARKEYLTSRLEELATFAGDYDEPYAAPEDSPSDPSILRADEVVVQAVDYIKSQLSAMIAEVRKRIDTIDNEHKAWLRTFEPIQKDYEKQIKVSGGDAVELDQKRSRVLSRVRSLESERSKLRDKAQAIKGIIGSRKAILDRISSRQKEYTEERLARCEHFTRESGGALRVTLEANADYSQFKENLGKLKKGSWLRDDEIELLAAKILPEQFVHALVGYAYSIRLDHSRLDAISTTTGIKADSLLKLADHLLDTYPVTELLALVYSSIPEDVPSICYRVDGEFKLLDELSVGQKATALLIIALSDGRFPIIIDQPEDSLDLKTIWEDICTKIRNNKEHRQFIFTTHNSSVAVASDTDKFTILRSTAASSENVGSGSINTNAMRAEVIDYLEGGEHTYEHKRAKYRK